MASASALRVTPLALQACRETAFGASDGSVASIVEDCVRAFEACRKQDPYHARAAHSQAVAARAQPTLSLAATATASSNRFCAEADARRLAGEVASARDELKQYAASAHVVSRLEIELQQEKDARASLELERARLERVA